MIRFGHVPEPAGFAGKAMRHGAKWLADHPSAKRPHDYWSEFKPALADGFKQLCGYSVLYEPVGTVDHFVSWDEDKSRAYDWSNLRFASAWLNSSKKSVRSVEILDPFDVQDGWFEILLPSLQLTVSSAVPREYLARARNVLTRLHLGHDERVMRQRREWYRMYQAGELTLEGLRKRAPLIAVAVDAASLAG